MANDEQDLTLEEEEFLLDQSKIMEERVTQRKFSFPAKALEPHKPAKTVAALISSESAAPT